MPSSPAPERAPASSATVRRRWLPGWTKRAAFEAGLIVLSLVLAYAANEWREARAQESRTREARALVAEELRFNRDSIASPEYLDHHRSLLEQYKALSDAERPAGEPIFESGVHIAPLRDSAWRTYSTPEVIGRVPYREIVVLADLYQEQERLERIHWTVVGWLLAPRSTDTSVAAVRALNRSVTIYLGDVVSTEERLLRRYAEALRMIGGGD